MSDRQLHSLGEYFVYHKLQEKYGWTFEQFISKWERGVFTL